MAWCSPPQKFTPCRVSPDQTASATADDAATKALASVTKHADDPAVKAYIDHLLTKYTAYLGTQQ